MRPAQQPKRAPSHPLEAISPATSDEDPPAQSAAFQEAAGAATAEASWQGPPAAVLPTWEAFAAAAPPQEAAVGARAEADADLAGDLQRLRLQRRLSHRGYVETQRSGNDCGAGGNQSHTSSWQAQQACTRGLAAKAACLASGPGDEQYSALLYICRPLYCLTHLRHGRCH